MKKILCLLGFALFTFSNTPVLAEEDDVESAEEEEEEEADESEESDEEEDADESEEEAGESEAPVVLQNVVLNETQKKEIHQSVDKVLGIKGPESSTAIMGNMKKENQRLKKENQQLKGELEKLKKEKEKKVEKSSGGKKVVKGKPTKNSRKSSKSENKKNIKWKDSSSKIQRRIYTIKNRGQGYNGMVNSFGYGYSNFVMRNEGETAALAIKPFVPNAPSYEVADMHVSAVQQNGKTVYTIKSNPTFQNSKTGKNLNANAGNIQNLFTDKNSDQNYFGKTGGCQNGCSKI